MKSRRCGAERSLVDAGYGGLWEWAMRERRSVRPPNWDELAYRLAAATDGEIQIKGEMLRKWLLAAEAERDSSVPCEQA